MIVSRKDTGRSWGDKLPFRVISKGGGVVTYEADLWRGPEHPGERGQYERIRSTVSSLANVGPNCSFYTELKKALEAA